MPIMSSVIIEDRPQIDGRRWVRERHTDQAGGVHERVYLAEVGQDVAAGFPAVVAILNQQLIDAEIAQDLAAIYQAGSAAAITTVHATLAAIRDALREAYRTATREQAFALGAYLNTLTNTQLGNLFGISGAALTALRNRLQTKAAQWADYVAAAGE